jgi:hypothetical protein
VIGEIGRDGFLQQRLVAGVPEIVECADCLYGRVALRVGDRHGDHEVIDLHTVGGKGRRGQRKRQCGSKPNALQAFVRRASASETRIGRMPGLVRAGTLQLM